MSPPRAACLHWSIPVLLALAGSAHAGTLSAVAPLGASPGVVVQITGTGFSATAASNEISFGTPAPVPATSIITINAAQGLRRLTARVPDEVPAGTVAVKVVNRDTGEVSTGRSLEVVTIGVAPAAAARGATVELLIDGSANARFSAGSTRVGLGAGRAGQAAPSSIPDGRPTAALPAGSPRWGFSLPG